MHVGSIHRIEIAILKVFIDRPVKIVGTALHHQVEYASGCTAKFGTELVLQNVELRDGLVGDQHRRTRDIAVVIVHTVDRKAIVLRPLARDGGTGSLANTA